MIPYDRDNWVRTCFSWTGTVLPQVLGQVGMLTGFCLLLYLVNEFALPHYLKLPIEDTAALTVLGVALSMLIVFRTNSSNNRYWEARSHWGMLINTSRNLIRLAAQAAGPADDLARLLTAYLFVLKEQLRDNPDLTSIRHLVPGRVMERLEQVGNRAQILAAFMTEWVLSRQTEGRLNPYTAMRLEALIEVLVDQQGACEKIHRTPLPFVYASLIKQVLFVYLLTLPFILVPRMTFMAPLIVAVLSLGLLGIENAGVELEDPFGLEPNHLPLDQLCAMVARDVADLTTKSSSGSNYSIQSELPSKTNGAQ
jgi:ion channel-forming bestrophin family protein